MIITIDVFLKLCAGISCVGLALSYLIKAINSVKKPVKDVNDKFKSYDELKDLEGDVGLYYYAEDKNIIYKW